MTRLFELTEQYQQVWGLVENEEIDLQVIEDTLQSIEGAIEVKAVNLSKIIRSLDNDLKEIKAEKERLDTLQKSAEDRKEWLKNYLQTQLEIAKMDKVKTATTSIWFQNNPPSVKVISEEGIPIEYWIPQAPTLDKKSILAKLKAGEEVVGVELFQGKSLRIR